MSLKGKTPAMAAGLTDSKMTMQELIQMIDTFHMPTPTFTVREDKDGGVTVVMDPNAYAPVLNIGDFENRDEAETWIRDESAAWFAKLAAGM
jgi:hypothetical protein